MWALEFSALDFTNSWDRMFKSLFFATLTHSGDYIISFYAKQHPHSTPQAVAVDLLKQCLILPPKAVKKGE